MGHTFTPWAIWLKSNLVGTTDFSTSVEMTGGGLFRVLYIEIATVRRRTPNLIEANLVGTTDFSTSVEMTGKWVIRVCFL